jgi:peptidoglycan/xylan/chitin deacetylase (PgdA/CDA1 family)
LKRRYAAFFALAALMLTRSLLPPPGAAVAAAGETRLPASQTKYVALTFDDGPRADTTPRLLDGLRQRGASATFFLVGEQIDANADVVKRMKEEGHQVGNHTWSHIRIKGASNALVEAEVSKTDAEIRKVLGDGVYWVRPPYGLIDESQEKLFTVPLVRWSVDPEDWKLRNADADVKAVLSHVRPGDIILMHDSVPASVDAALRIVDTLEAQGYEFVTVQELLELYGVTPQPGVAYRSARLQQG